MHVPAHRLQTAKSDHSQRETEFLKQRAKCVDVHHAVEAAALTRVGCFLLLMAYASTDRLFFFLSLASFCFLVDPAGVSPDDPRRSQEWLTC